MVDIFQEVEEDLRRERYERLAKKYGGTLVAALLSVVAATAGFVLWKNWQLTRQQTATLQLAEAVEDAGRDGANPAGIPVLDSVIAHAPSGPAALARFYEAGIKGRTGDSAGAVILYDGLSKDGSLPQVFRDLALLLSIQQQAGSGDAKLLSERLATLTLDANPWHFSARELDALLAVRTGDKAKAKTLFHQLADDKDAPAGIRARAAELAAFFDKAP